jgi:hypothetical protein
MLLSRAVPYLAASLVATGLAFVGCNKSSSGSASADIGDASDQLTPRDYFINTVYPLIGGLSTCGGCHSGQANSPCAGAACVFLGSDGPSSYDAISQNVGLIAAPQNSPLVTYQHKDSTIQLTPDQANVLDIWLGMEAAARHLPGAVAKATSLNDALTQFGNCMNYDVFTQTGMANLAQIETDMYGPCLGCHNRGQGGLFLAADPFATFQNFQKFPFIETLVVGTVDSNGNFAQLVPAELISQKSSEGCTDTDPTQCHPRFGLSPTETDWIRTFVNTTLQNLAAQTCQNGIVTAADASAPPGDAGEGGN